jgi:lysozyme
MNADTVRNLAKDQLRKEEGCRLKMYKDTKGLSTVGIGWCLDRSPMRLTEAEFRLTNDVGEAFYELLQALPWIGSLDDMRASVLVQLCFQLGLHGLLEFGNMLRACQAGNWPGAANQLLDSKYAREDCPARAARYAAALELGKATA